MVSCVSFMCDSLNTHVITLASSKNGGCGWSDVLSEEVFPRKGSKHVARHHSVSSGSPNRLTTAVPSLSVVSSNFVAPATFDSGHYTINCFGAVAFVTLQQSLLSFWFSESLCASVGAVHADTCPHTKHKHSSQFLCAIAPSS